MKAVFLDTVGLLALWDRSDQWHPAASQAYESLKSVGGQLVTSTLILLECANAAARRPYRGQVNQLRLALASSGQLIAPTDLELEQAWEAGAGIVDQVSFLVMRRLLLTQAFTNDEHFRAAGFENLF
jgi:uncharacterized protein